MFFPKDLPDAPFPKIPPDGARIRFPAYHDPDHGFWLRCRFFATLTLANPQIKKLSASEQSFLGKVLESCLPSDALLRTEPLFWLQRLYLGQLFPAFFAAARQDFSSSGSLCSGQKAVFVATFSFGRLIGSFHEARIIVTFLENIQRFVLFFFFLFFLA